MKVVIGLFDIHYPYHINLDGVYKFIEQNKPDEIIIGGDAIDCEGMSKKFYSGSPEEGLAKTVEEIRGFKNILERLKSINNAKIIFLMGNHEYRIVEKLAEYPSLKVLLDLEVAYKGLVDEWIDYNKYYKVGPLYYLHGTYHNDAFAKKHAMMYQKNVRFGHLHCFDSETEVLTDSGFKLFQDLNKDKDLVVTENLDKGVLEYNKINEMVEYDNYKELTKIKTGHVDLVITEDHGLVNYTKKKPERIKCSELLSKSVWKFKTGGQITKEGIDLTDDEIRMIVQIVTDGYINGGKRVDFHLNKQRKIDRVCDLFSRNGIPCKKNIQITGNTKIHLNLKDLRISKYIEFGNKELPQDFRYLNKHQVDILLDEYTITDGHSYGNSIQLSTGKEQEADLLQELMVTNGYRCNKTPKYVDGKEYYTLSVYIKHQFNEFKSKTGKVTKVKYDGIVRCISVDNGTLLVRRKGKTCITQNTSQEYCLATPLNESHVSSKSIPCLSTLNPGYMKNKPNAWHNGFNIAYIDGDNYNDYNIVINDGHFIYNGITY